MRLAAELDVHVYVHTWLKVRRHTAACLAATTGRPNRRRWIWPNWRSVFPRLRLICGHSGGDWELGVRAVRPYKNVLWEFAWIGSSIAGMVDYADQRTWAWDRLVWGGATAQPQLCYRRWQGFDADISKGRSNEILGGNLRRFAHPSSARKVSKLSIDWTGLKDSTQ
jgi:hypothetical protein